MNGIPREDGRLQSSWSARTLIRDKIHLSKRVAEDEGSISAEPSAMRVPLLLLFSICCLRDENVTLRDKVK